MVDVSRTWTCLPPVAISLEYKCMNLDWRGSRRAQLRASECRLYSWTRAPSEGSRLPVHLSAAASQLLAPRSQGDLVEPVFSLIHSLSRVRVGATPLGLGIGCTLSVRASRPARHRCTQSGLAREVQCGQGTMLNAATIDRGRKRSLCVQNHLRTRSEHHHIRTRSVQWMSVYLIELARHLWMRLATTRRPSCRFLRSSPTLLALLTSPQIEAPKIRSRHTILFASLHASAYGRIPTGISP